jgi:hypothetical protein
MGSCTSSKVLIIGFTALPHPKPLPHCTRKLVGGEGLLTAFGLGFEVLRLILMPETTWGHPYSYSRFHY